MWAIGYIFLEEITSCARDLKFDTTKSTSPRELSRGARLISRTSTASWRGLLRSQRLAMASVSAANELATITSLFKTIGRFHHDSQRTWGCDTNLICPLTILADASPRLIRLCTSRVCRSIRRATRSDRPSADFGRMGTVYPVSAGTAFRTQVS